MATTVTWLTARHPFEMGPAAWLLGQIETHGSLLGLVHWFTVNIAVEDQGFVWTSQQMRECSGVLAITWWLCFILVLVLGGNTVSFNPFNDTTSRQFNQYCFDVGTDYTIATQCFGYSINAVSDKMREDCQDWLNRGWQDWTERKPLWFTEGWKETVMGDGYDIPVVKKKVSRRRTSYGAIQRVINKDGRAIAMD